MKTYSILILFFYLISFNSSSLFSMKRRDNPNANNNRIKSRKKTNKQDIFSDDSPSDSSENETDSSPEEGNIIPCDKCNRFIKTKVPLYNINTEQPGDNISIKTDKMVVISEEDAIKAHWMVYHQTCLDCNIEFKSYQELINHLDLRKSRSTHGIYLCDYCHGKQGINEKGYPYHTGFKAKNIDELNKHKARCVFGLNGPTPLISIKQEESTNPSCLLRNTSRIICMPHDNNDNNDSNSYDDIDDFLSDYNSASYDNYNDNNIVVFNNNNVHQQLPANKFVCRTCDNHFSTEIMLILHALEKHSQCPWCQTNCPPENPLPVTKFFFTFHAREKHAEKYLYYCMRCDALTNDATLGKLHHVECLFKPSTMIPPSLIH